MPKMQSSAEEASSSLIDATIHFNRMKVSNRSTAVIRCGVIGTRELLEVKGAPSLLARLVVEPTSRHSGEGLSSLRAVCRCKGLRIDVEGESIVKGGRRHREAIFIGRGFTC